MVRGSGKPIVKDDPLVPATVGSNLMFTIVTFPWPIASAHVQLDGLGRQAKRAHATTHTATVRNLNPAGQDELASEPEERRNILTARKV
jgi:hypothetical protein